MYVCVYKGIYFKELAHAIVEAWQIQSPMGGQHTGDPGNNCNSKAVCGKPGRADVANEEQSAGRFPSFSEEINLLFYSGFQLIE